MKYHLIILLLIEASCSSLAYQHANNSLEKPWGVCKASGILNGDIKIFSLSKNNQKNIWLEGHSNFQLSHERWNVDIRGELYTENNTKICVSSFTIFKNELKYMNKVQEVFVCDNSLIISPSVRLLLKSEDNKWHSQEFDCKAQVVK